MPPVCLPQLKTGDIRLVLAILRQMTEEVELDEGRQLVRPLNYAQLTSRCGVTGRGGRQQLGDGRKEAMKSCKGAM